MNELKPILLPPAREKVASEIRKAILSKKFKKGEVLYLEAIATQLGVSATPVREAFQILARDSLIELRRNKGAVVLGITKKYIEDHYELRALLESSVCEIICDRKLSVAVSEEICQKAQAEMDKGEFTNYSDYNYLFHYNLWKLTGNEKLITTLSELWNGLSLGNTITEEEYSKISHDEHQKIIESLKKFDKENSKRLMTEHLVRSKESMLTFYA